MKRIFLGLALGIILSIQGAVAQSSTDFSVPQASEIRKILVDRIDAFHQGVGIVVGVIDPNGRRIVTYGSLNQGDSRPLNGDTIFEIGSITKVFTSLLLSDMVQRGEVSLADPVAKYLPADVKVPERNGRVITLVDLSTHTAGLPRMPSNFNPKDPANPYADYTVEQLFQFISSYQLTRDIGSKFEYSNLGGGLLGQVLARRAGLDYEALERARIAIPLGMTSTGITLSPEMKARLAVGHNAQMTAVPNWDLGAMAGAGALRSSANDMLTFLAANLGFVKSPLAPAMAAMVSTRRPTGAPGMGDIGLGWLITKASDGEIVWHNGGTGGYRSFIGYDAKTRVGVVVLSNASTAAGCDDIGMHLLDSQQPLLAAPKEHKEVKVDGKIFDGYLGLYQLAPDFILSITREGDQLFAQATGQPKAPIFPESQRDFFYKVVDAQITFETDAGGRATSLKLQKNGRNMPAKRIEGEVPAAAPKEHKEIAINPKLFDGYVGLYQLGPNFVLSITREGSQLFAQTTGQAKLPAFPEGERAFFFKDVDAQITFETDSRGRATSLTLHQGGHDSPAKRVEGQVPAAAPKEHKEITGAPELFDHYVGQYQLAPDFILTITREGDQLFAQASGQDKARIFPESQRDFFYKVVDAQITFETDASGRANSLALHQGGVNQTAKRIEGNVAPADSANAHKEVKIDPNLLDGYVGRYQLAPSFVLTVTREGNQLFGQPTGQSKAQLFPEGPRDFFFKIVDAQITFESDSSGHVTGLTLHQNGLNVPGKRIVGEMPAAAPEEHKEIPVDPGLFDKYVGQYQLLPNLFLTITREGDQLFAQATGQDKAQIFPESQRDFFYKVVDAQITFETDSSGRVISLTLHQGGADMPANRIQ